MCRLAAFPPGFPQGAALKILARFARGNEDGTGSVYVKDGEFVVNKWPLALSKVVSRELPLLAHMPYDGWTVCHLRAASHGVNATRNTHPFNKGEWSIVHNGIWSEYELVKAALKGRARFEGETDSEVAAELFSTVGPKRFGNVVKMGGVFLGLKKTGELWAVKTSGSLEMLDTKFGRLLGSTLPESLKPDTVPEGWLHFDTKGELLADKEYKRYIYKGSSSSSSSSSPCGFHGGMFGMQNMTSHETPTESVSMPHHRSPSPTSSSKLPW